MDTDVCVVARTKKMKAQKVNITGNLNARVKFFIYENRLPGEVSADVVGDGLVDVTTQTSPDPTQAAVLLSETLHTLGR
jgi:hypothetical protein